MRLDIFRTLLAQLILGSFLIWSIRAVPTVQVNSSVYLADHFSNKTLAKYPNTGEQPDHLHSRAKKSAPDITLWLYKYDKEDVEEPKLEDERWDILNWKGTVVDTLSFRRKNEMCTVWDAKNAVVDDTPDRLRLRDILMGFWKDKSGASPSKIKTFYFDAVTEPSTYNTINAVNEALKKKPGQKYTLKNNSGTKAEKAAFAQLVSDAKLIGMVNAMLGEFIEFAEKGKIKSIDIRVGQGTSHFVWVHI